jgi:MoaA/NifB/PqqE/SkfB family radical SAM enzyme
MHVHPNGNVFMCCYQRRVPLGNLTEQSFEEVWYGSIANEVRQEIIKSNLPHACTGGGCPFEVNPRHASTFEIKRHHPVMLFLYLPNTHCNIGGEKPSKARPACLMCERSAPDYEFDKATRLPEILPLLRPQLRHMGQIHVQGVAEAFWKDAFFEILDALDWSQHRERVVASTVTNATLLTKKTALRFLEACPLSGLGLSMDAASRETYKAIRRVDAYDVVCRNAIEFGKLRKDFPKNYLKIQNNLNTINVHEAVAMVRFAKEIGADEIEFCPTVGYRTEILVNETNWKSFAEAEWLAKEEASRIGQKITFLTPLALHFGRRETILAV